MAPLGKHDLLGHLKTTTLPLASAARSFTYRAGSFEKRWSRLRRAAQDRIDTDYRTERADDLRTGRNEYSIFATLFKTYVGRLRLATEVSRRLAADGYDGGVPGPNCRGKTTDPLMIRACSFGLAIQLRGVAGQMEYLRHFNEPAALHVDFGLYLQRDGQFTSAVEVLNRAVARGRKTGHALAVVQALHHLGNVLADMNQLARAETAYTQALDLRRSMTSKGIDDHWIELSTTLNNSHTVLLDQGKSDKAEAPLKEAFGLRMGLATADPDTYLANVGVSLNNFGQLYDKLERSADAARAEELVVAVNRYLLRSRPALYGAELAGGLEMLAGHYLDQGRTDQAEAAALASANEYTDLIRDDGPFHADRARMLLMYGELRLEAGDPERGYRALEDAVATFRYLGARQHRKSQPLLRNALNRLAKAFAAQGRSTEARSAIEEAAQLQSPSRRP